MQGVSTREDDITGLRPVYDRCFGTSIDDSAWPVSVNAERVTLGRSEVLEIHLNFFLSVLPTDIPMTLYNDKKKTLGH